MTRKCRRVGNEFCRNYRNTLVPLLRTFLGERGLVSIKTSEENGPNHAFSIQEKP